MPTLLIASDVVLGLFTLVCLHYCGQTPYDSLQFGGRCCMMAVMIVHPLESG